MLGRHIATCLGLLFAPPGGHAADSVLQVRGVVAIEGHWHAAISTAETGAQRWYRRGDGIGAFTIDSIRVDGVTLVGVDGRPRVLHLAAAKVRDLHAPPDEPEAWVEWVNSHDNPMRDQPAPLPIEPASWAALPREVRRAIVDRYRDHGWELRVEMQAAAASDFEFTPLLGAARQAILAEKQRAFLSVLSPEQRTLHTAALREPVRRPAVQTESARRRFLASLSPLQRVSFEQLGDFSVPPRRE